MSALSKLHILEQASFIQYMLVKHFLCACLLNTVLVPTTVLNVGYTGMKKKKTDPRFCEAGIPGVLQIINKMKKEK